MSLLWNFAAQSGAPGGSDKASWLVTSHIDIDVDIDVDIDIDKECPESAGSPTGISPELNAIGPTKAKKPRTSMGLAKTLQRLRICL